jgi:Helix-turn-helix domain
LTWVACYESKAVSPSPSPSPIDPLVEAIAQRVAELLRRDLGLERQRLMSVAEAAAYPGRTPYAVRHLIAQHILPAVRRDGRVHLDRQDLDRWIDLSKTKG